jgi:hypothetical protein
VNPAADWSNFLVTEAGASAALAGLIFVSISINLTKIIEYPDVASRAGEALSLLMGTLFICTVALAPNQPQKLLGAEFLIVGGLLWVLTVSLHVGQFRRRDQRPWWWLASRAFVCNCATLSLCIAGISLMLAHPSGMYWLIPGCVFSFVAATTIAWVLLIEIVR